VTVAGETTPDSLFVPVTFYFLFIAFSKAGAGNITGHRKPYKAITSARMFDGELPLLSLYLNNRTYYGCCFQIKQYKEFSCSFSSYLSGLGHSGCAAVGGTQANLAAQLSVLRHQCWSWLACRFTASVLHFGAGNCGGARCNDCGNSRDDAQTARLLNIMDWRFQLPGWFRRY
jgi:hypothetical protein